MTRPLRLLLPCLIAALALVVAACGGDAKEASSSTDVNTLLTDTFKGGKKIKSGDLKLAVRIDAKNTQGLSGPVTLSIAGPFQSQGKQQLPKFKIDFAFAGAGESIKAGLTSTGTKGFVNFQGTDYAVTDQLLRLRSRREADFAHSVSCGCTSVQGGGVMPPSNGWMSCCRNPPGLSEAVASGCGATSHTLLIAS